LLGGMTEVPTSEWSNGFDIRNALDHAPRFQCTLSWRRRPGAVTHVFTHFPLELVVYTASVAAGTRAPRGMRWATLGNIGGEALPNVMRKVLAHALGDAVRR
jgi:A/G-specific adenine glycosylase